MLRQRLAADEDIARKNDGARAARGTDDGGAAGSDNDWDIFNAACEDDDTTGTNVMPPASNAHAVLAHAYNAKDCCITAGYSKSNNSRLPDS
ncbi:unnamed protein product, partial [Laminaria digitata]